MKILTVVLCAVVLSGGVAFAQRGLERGRAGVASQPTGGKDGTEITATPKIGESTVWVMRIGRPIVIPAPAVGVNGANAVGNGASDNAARDFSLVRFYQAEKKQSVQAHSLVAPEPKFFLGELKGWAVGRPDISKLEEILVKFGEWSEVARKNNVKEVHKEIGVLPMLGDTLYFHIGNEGGIAGKNCLILTRRYEPAGRERKLNANDVSALLELVGQLPAIEDKRRGAPVPDRATDALFK